MKKPSERSHIWCWIKEGLFECPKFRDEAELSEWICISFFFLKSENSLSRANVSRDKLMDLIFKM